MNSTLAAFQIFIDTKSLFKSILLAFMMISGENSEFWR